jgi:hypothetical protein
VAAPGTLVTSGGGSTKMLLWYNGSIDSVLFHRMQPELVPELPFVNHRFSMMSVEMFPMPGIPARSAGVDAHMGLVGQ